ncbi:MAG TPA: lytic murein transglycosylase [Desulfobacterales bacterium]|nr:lytic murein transglycosylase [Desulfobacterales bacterium]
MILFRFKTFRFLIFFFGLFIPVFLFPISDIESAEIKGDFFGLLQARLIRDGFDQTMIKSVYKNPKVYLDKKIIKVYFTYREAKLNYNQFTTRRSITKARTYIREHMDAFQTAEKNFGVDREIITAIILVETQLGKVMGKKSVLNTFSTLAALADPNVRDTMWKEISRTRKLDQKKFEKWSARKSKWAYRELKAYLKYSAKEKIPPSEVNGSFAGAMGIAQFLPSSILAYAKDGNNDGRIDLFNHSDAIASIAGYLKNYGWHPGIDGKKAYKIVYRYNRSSYYVNTVLKIAELLKG